MAALDFPASPTNGQLYPAAPNAQYIYNSTAGGPTTGAWESLPLVEAKTVTADVPPSTPQDGDQWFNTVDGTLYVYVVDIDGGQWVESQAPITANGYYSPNHLINGAMDIWQRGTSFTSTGYGADRWYLPISNATVSQETSDLPAGFRYGIKYVTTATGFAQFNQAIERDTVISLRGKTVTFSAYVKISGSFSGNWANQAYYSNSTDAYSSLTTIVPGSAKNVASSATSSWTRITNTFTVPSDAVGLRIENLPDVQSATGATVRMTGMQLEEGSIATTFRRNANSLQGELAACQRYFQTSYPYGATIGAASDKGFISAAGYYEHTTTSYIIWGTVFPVQMRSAPTVTAYSVNGGTVNKCTRDRIGVGSSDGNVAIDSVGTTGCRFVSDQGQLASYALVHYTASAEL